MNLEQRLVDAFGKEHPVAVARRIEGADPVQVADLLQGVSTPVAARVVSKASPLAVTDALGRLPAERAVALLGQLDPWCVCALLSRIDWAAREKLLSAMPGNAAESARRMLAYPADRVGARMDPRAPSVLASRTAEEALELVKRSPDGTLYYVYVTDEHQRLVGALNLRELLSAQGQRPVTEIMVNNPEHVHASDSLETLARHPAWRKVHALPVVDERNHLLGAVRYSTFRAIEAEIGRALSGRDPSKTANALAELLWLAASAAVRTVETAIVGTPPSRREEGS